MNTKNEIISLLEERGIEWDVLEVKDGSWCILVPVLGAKMIAAGVDEENVFWVSPDIAPGTWRAGGLRTWLSPELGGRGYFVDPGNGEWFVPPGIDPGTYREAERKENGIKYSGTRFTVQSPMGEAITVRMEREVKIQRPEEAESSGVPGGSRFTVKQGIINAGDKIMRKTAGLWSILQLPNSNGGTIFMGLTDTCRTKPGKDCYRVYFGEVPNSHIKKTGSLLLLKAHPGIRNKIGVAPGNARGIIGYLRPSLLESDKFVWILKSFNPDGKGTYLDCPQPPVEETPRKTVQGDILQAYNDPQTGAQGFSEIECHAPAVELSPGEEDWFVMDLTLGKGKFQDFQEKLKGEWGIEIPFSLSQPDFFG